jgi:hypothetical protein
MGFWGGLILGMFFGGTLGMLALALVTAAKTPDDDEWQGRARQAESNLRVVR